MAITKLKNNDLVEVAGKKYKVNAGELVPVLDKPLYGEELTAGELSKRLGEEASGTHFQVISSSRLPSGSVFILTQHDSSDPLHPYRSKAVVSGGGDAWSQWIEKDCVFRVFYPGEQYSAKDLAESGQARDMKFILRENPRNTDQIKSGDTVRVISSDSSGQPLLVYHIKTGKRAWLSSEIILEGTI